MLSWSKEYIVGNKYTVVASETETLDNLSEGSQNTNTKHKTETDVFSSAVRSPTVL